jgi:AraC family transcriptional regulator of adaptative response/methylated-DNA-[protein]-cysteine methyltransferase
MKLSYEDMVVAMTGSDSSFDGVFWIGVQSTGIYCLPSCPARTPLLKNVEFFESREDAIAAGLRGCKRCRSEQYPDVLPEWVRPLIDEMKRNVSTKFDEAELCRLAGVDISTVRRHFKRQLGITPLAYHRRIRLLHARRMIESGASYLAAGYDSGFESSSGFRDAYVREFGEPPGRCNGRK